MDRHDIFPVAKSTASYWRKDPHELDSYRSTEQLPQACDVLIIGAGLSGVATAYHLLNKNSFPPSTVLLEAREICSGATGRNGGHAMMSPTLIDQFTKDYNIETAREMCLFRTNQIYAMKRVAEIEDLDCDAVLTRCFETILTQAHADELKETYDKQLKEGLDFIQDIDFIGPKHAERLSGIKGAKAALTSISLQMWPYKFVTGLLARLVERTSINVQTHTLVTSISTSDDGYSIVETPRGFIRAKKLVFATNAYTAGISPTFYKKIVPIKGTCSHISVPQNSASLPPHLSHTYGLRFNGLSVRDYLIPRPDGGVICGGANQTYNKEKELWFNNCDDSTLLEPARQHFETVMQDNFRGWENSGAAVDYMWTGIMGQTADRLPYCGKVPGQQNQFVLAGFNGGGMIAIFLTARGIAKMIKEDIPFEESGIPRIFKATEGRLAKDVDGLK